MGGMHHFTLSIEFLKQFIDITVQREVSKDCDLRTK
jgi:hypothetical protein